MMQQQQQPYQPYGGQNNPGYGQQNQPQMYQPPMQQQQQPPQAQYGQPSPYQQNNAYGGYSAAPVPPAANPPYGQPTPAPSEWKSASSADGQVYYYNERTGATQWDKPAGMP
mmetsp:Transcript_20039/g.55750  ORF Transcript_20039/g.55750 Transcript_20039/m.55750 type:complete len:112 (-) Transcript_20039:2093-2428(-)